MNSPLPGFTVPDPLIMKAYQQAAEQNVLAALNPDIFFGYFSVCADGVGHGNNTTYPGLDWGQSLEALLWLGRTAEVLANWDYVRSFLKENGALPFAILPSEAGRTPMLGGYAMPVDPNGGVYRHWCPGNPLQTLPNTTFIRATDAIFRHTQDREWLAGSLRALQQTSDFLLTLITPAGLVGGAGYYLERPTRIEFDGVSQCYTAHALRLAAGLMEAVGDQSSAERCREAAQQIVGGFQRAFWAGDHCVEYIHPAHGAIDTHGLTDVDWAAIAMGMLPADQESLLWERLKQAEGFRYGGMPTGIATNPTRYEDWEMQSIDRHDLAAMGRVWYLEAWARARMGDAEGLVDSLRQVAAAGCSHNGYWRERYYSDDTGDLAAYSIDKYVEYPANLIRIVHQFLFGTTFNLDGSVTLAPVMPSHWFQERVALELTWGGSKARTVYS